MDDQSRPNEPVEDKQTRVPEWEHEAVGKNGDGRKASITPRRFTGVPFSSKLDAILPSHRRYLGMSRKIFLWILLAVILALLALIIGLAVGLGKKYVVTNV